MTSKFIAVLFVLCLPLFPTLYAQDCFNEAMLKAAKLLNKGKNEEAKATMEAAKKCPGANVTLLEEYIRRVDDYDLDYVPNKLDECPNEFGAKETKGCPCAETYRWKGIDYYYDGLVDSASIYFGLAKECSDLLDQADIATWEGKTASKKAEKALVKQVDNEIFNVVQQKPEYPNGEMSILQFIGDNVHYPPLARENGVEGTVYVRFIIEKDGQVSHVEVIRDIGAGCGKEAARVVRKMPLWAPGKQDGQYVRVFFTLPVKYKLE
ncbi:MAG: energy transducer TonB [Saprospiraceae bacterium]|nr:energy transducer TonB [Saprospiraceae bacterium]